MFFIGFKADLLLWGSAGPGIIKRLEPAKTRLVLARCRQELKGSNAKTL